MNPPDKRAVRRERGCAANGAGCARWGERGCAANGAGCARWGVGWMPRPARGCLGLPRGERGERLLQRCHCRCQALQLRLQSRELLP